MRGQARVSLGPRRTLVSGAMRRWVLAAAATALIVMPAVLAFFSGGFFDEPRIIAALVAWALVLVAGLTAPRPLPTSTAGRLALLGLALLCAWTGISVAWAPLGGPAQDDFQRVLLYLGYFTAALALLRGPDVRRALEPALAIGAFVVVAYALCERLLPGLFELERSASAGGRLEQPFTYWNAAGISAAVGFILAARVAGDPTRPGALRGVLAAVAVPLGLGVYLSFARGALVAVALGLLVLVALAPDGRAQLRSAIVLVAASALAGVVANGYPTVKSLGESDSGDGLVMLAVLLVLAVAAGVLAPREPRRRLELPELPGSRPAVVTVVAVVAAIGAGLAVAAYEGDSSRDAPATGANPARLASIDTNRYRYWEVAIDSFAGHPFGGLGSGGFAVEWLKLPDRPDAVRDAHSLYLETAAELGVVGVALLLLFLGGVVAAGVRLYRLDARAAAGPAAGLAAWILHAGLDWDWEMPAVTLTALLLAAALVSWNEELAPGG
jgi:O-Antigen ligase